MVALSRDTELSGRYRLTGRIATGGMGEVWRAEDTLLHRKVAVKVLKSELTVDPTFLERFRAEARNTAALTHQGIAGVHDYGEIEDGDQRTAYLVMELVEGQPLSAVLAQEGRLAVNRVLDIVEQAAAALDAAHRTGMVHRDVKPGNLIVTPDGTVKVTDFGIARVTDTVPLTQAGMVVGTAQYFAPEQAEGRTTTPASDVYSLGVVAYECLAGRLPFVADSSVAVAVMQIRDQAPPLPDDVPPPVRALVARAMAKDPRMRFTTGGDFAAAVRAVREGRPIDESTMMMAGPPASQTRVLPTPPPPAMPGVGPAVPPPPMAPVPPAAQAGPAAPAGPVGPLGPPSMAGPTPIPPPMQPPPPGAPHAGLAMNPATSTGTHVRPPLPPPPPRKRTNTALLAVVVAVAVAAIAVLAVVIARRDSSEGTGRVGNERGSTPSATSEGGAGSQPTNPEQPPPATVFIEPAHYVGRQVEDVAAELQTRGLRPYVRYAEDVNTPYGAVISVNPTGNVLVGTKVEILVSGPPGKVKNKQDNNDD